VSQFDNSAMKAELHAQAKGRAPERAKSQDATSESGIPLQIKNPVTHRVGGFFSFGVGN